MRDFVPPEAFQSEKLPRGYVKVVLERLGFLASIQHRQNGGGRQSDAKRRNTRDPFQPYPYPYPVYGQVIQ